MSVIVEPNLLRKFPECWDELPKSLRKKVFDGFSEREWSLPILCCGTCNIKTEVSLKGGKVEYYMFVIYFDMFISAETKILWSLPSLIEELSKIREYIGDDEEESSKFDDWYQKIF